MYQTIITLKDNIPANALVSICGTIATAFDNRAGKLQNVSKDPHVLVFEGGEALFGCLQLGILNLYKTGGIVNCLSSWQWIDLDEPNESCDVLQDMSVPIN